MNQRFIELSVDIRGISMSTQCNKIVSEALAKGCRIPGRVCILKALDHAPYNLNAVTVNNAKEINHNDDGIRVLFLGNLRTFAYQPGLAYTSLFGRLLVGIMKEQDPGCIWFAFIKPRS